MRDAVVHHERIRLTGSLKSKGSTLLKGVPLTPDNKARSARYVVQAWVNDDRLPVTPTPGQTWLISGPKEITKSDQGNFIVEIHFYTNLKSVHFFLPNTGETFVNFIAKDIAFKGIGESKARDLWNKFGENIHVVLKDTGGKYLEQLKEILSEHSIKNLYEGYAKYENLEHTVWMAKAGIPAGIQRRVLKYHKRGTIEALKENPYELVNFGLTINQVDKIKDSEDSVWDGDYSIKRIEAAAIQGLSASVANGSTYTTLANLRAKISYILNNDKESVEKAISIATLPTNSVDCRDYLDEDRIHPISIAIQELAVAKRFEALINRNRVTLNAEEEQAVSAVLKSLPYEATFKQMSAVQALLVSDLACLTGGAGTGKTFTCNIFLKTAQALGYEIHAVALSGRAAMRLNESIDMPTSTIAKFLKNDPVQCSERGKKILLIDEASMVDLPTMFKIINHISPYVKIIFVGDPNQLPPIGAGKILHDLASSSLVSKTELDIVKRQKGSSGIPEYTASIKNGVVPKSLSVGNIYFHETAPSEIEQLVLELYQQDPVNTRIISSTRDRTKQLNNAIQATFNSDSPRLDFRIGDERFYASFNKDDQVLFTKNHYDIGVQNGTLGRLVNTEQTDDSIGNVLTDTNELIKLNETLLDCMELGYAITLHKAQGSQFPRVIVVLEENRITDRSWLYTAVTRSESEVHILGSEKVFAKITEDEPKAFKRKTLLSDLIFTLSIDR